MLAEQLGVSQAAMWLKHFHVATCHGEGSKDWKMGAA